MNASRTLALKSLSIVESSTDGPHMPTERWVPSPKVRGSIAQLMARLHEEQLRGGFESSSCSADPNRRAASARGPSETEQQEDAVPASCAGIRFGFAAPDDRLISLNIPAEDVSGQTDPYVSFDIEFNADQPDRVTISLMGLDEDLQIYTIQKTVAFPARLLADLLNRRKATPEEVEQWLNAESEQQCE